MANKVEVALNVFDANVGAVRQLMNFDRDVLDLAIKELTGLREKLRQLNKIDNPQLSAENTLKVLERVREHDSLRGRYKTVFNQALVLLVSYFGSAVGELFKISIMHSLMNEGEAALLDSELKVSLRELKDADFRVGDTLADMFVDKQDISFQDMQSISRSFKKYLGIDVPAKDKTVNGIILGQAARHVIVHSGGIVDDRLIRQVAKANPRDVKSQLAIDTEIQFTPEEVEVVAAGMRTYIQALGNSLVKKMDLS